jgi:hypothetical protein
MKKVFLGGTCNDSTWREEIIPLLNIDYFNPVVKNWTPQCQEEEIKQRKECDYVLYVITPKLVGLFSIAELIDDSNKRPEKTLFCYLITDGDYVFNNAQLSSLKAIKDMVIRNDALYFNSLLEVADYLNLNKY